MNIFAKLFRKDAKAVPEPEPQIRVQLVTSHALTLTQWRKQDKLVADAIVLTRNSTFQMMMQVLMNEHPARNGFVSVGVSRDDRAAHQSKTEGYEACLNKIKEMSLPWALSKPLVPTFQAPNVK